MSQNTHYLIRGLTVHTENGPFPCADVRVANGKIKEIGHLTARLGEPELPFPPEWHLIPGMIDLHIHGAAGADIMDATPESLQTICQTLPAEGVTAFLGSTLSEPTAQIDHALENVANYQSSAQQASGAELLGIHLEGPFLAAGKAGAQKIDCLQNPDIAQLDRWQQFARQAIKMVTLAPELLGALPLIQHLQEHGIIAAIGHTQADYDTTIAAIQTGISHATHLFNAMPPIHHRKPGPVVAALLNQTVTTELIADGIHLHPAILELVAHLKSPEHIILVTDAMRAKHLPDGEYTLGDQKVWVKDRAARLANGALAGSTLTMDAALRHMLHFTHLDLEAVLQMVSTNPAKKLNVFDQRGSIAPGKWADLVVLNDTHHVQHTFCKGQIFSSKMQ